MIIRNVSKQKQSRNTVEKAYIWAIYIWFEFRVWNTTLKCEDKVYAIETNYNRFLGYQIIK